MRKARLVSKQMQNTLLALSFASTSLLAGAAFAGKVSFQDPKGDDNGPGSYEYPSKPVYEKGAFDLRSVEIKEKGSKIEITVEIGTTVKDAWESKRWPTPGNGFSVQMFQVYADTDGKKGSGHDKALPGMNAKFADDSRWEKVFMISPQSNKRVSSEVKQKAKEFANDVVLPKKVVVRGKKVIATFDKKALGGKVEQTGWQVLVGSNEGFPKGKDLLSRKVNEYPGGDRFGGVTDGDVDPHFVDCLAGKGKGGDDEKKAQHDMLKFDEKANKQAELVMVRK